MMLYPTIVYTFRDKPVERLINSVESIRRFPGGKDAKIIVVDYGSTEKYRLALESACTNFNIRMIRTETEGMAWSRGIAMNIGILAAETEIFISTDIDMIFEFDLVAEICSKLKQQSKLHCSTYWLPPSGNRHHADVHGEGQHYGGCMAMYVNDFKSIGCFDERIDFWGAEDSELHHRASKCGITTNWLSRDHKMYHVWHRVSHGFGDIRPISSIVTDKILSLRSLVQSTNRDLINACDCGNVLTLNDRPLLQLLYGKGLNNCIDYSGKVTPQLIKQMIESLSNGNIVFLKTGPRTFYDMFSFGPRAAFVFKICSKIDRLLGKIGLSLSLKFNPGQDWIHLIIAEFDLLIDDYYWDFNEGCYFCPKGLTGAK